MVGKLIEPIFSKEASFFSGFSSFLEVSICFIEHDGVLLVLQRNVHSLQGGKWCIPGGKMEVGETPRMAVSREVFEEIGWRIPDEEFKFKYKIFERIPTIGDYILNVFGLSVETPFPVHISLSEHSTYEWVSHTEFEKMELMLGQQQLYDMMYKNDLQKN